MTTVLLIDEAGSKMGNMDLNKARSIATARGLDLIEVNPQHNVFRLGDLGKLKYDRKQKQRKQKRIQKSQKIKEIQLRPTTDSGDIEVKTKKIREFLDKGLKTKLVMKFKRSQMGYRDLGIQKINSILEVLVSEGYVDNAAQPKVDGNRISVMISPAK